MGILFRALKNWRFGESYTFFIQSRHSAGHVRRSKKAVPFPLILSAKSEKNIPTNVRSCVQVVHEQKSHIPPTRRTDGGIKTGTRQVTRRGFALFFYRTLKAEEVIAIL